MNTAVIQEDYLGIPVYRLRCGEMSAAVVPQEGMNLCDLSWREVKVLETNLQRRANGGTWGMPVLYPTPNRVSGGAAHFQGEELPLNWRGKPLLIHGAARFMAFTVVEATALEDRAVLSGAVEFVPGSEAYQYFPYHSRLTLTVMVFSDRVEVSHKVENLDTRAMAFGLAYHPFFRRLEGTVYRTGAASYYLTDENKLPSGELASAAGEYDLSRPISPDDRALDHVYTQLPSGEASAEIWYPQEKVHLQLLATEDFSHLVVFTPPGASFFCLENQTCSTDCHNLSRSCSHTGLQTVAPGAQAKGTVTLAFREMEGK